MSADAAAATSGWRCEPRGQISTPELSYAANLIQSRNFRAFEAFIVATALYLLLAMALRRLLNWLGPRFLYGR